jgi:hypothetical protein
MRILAGPVAALMVFGTVGIANADAIDGDWCDSNGKNFHIEGPNIRIPSGREITGDYERHGFRYVGPEGDPEAGQDIHMSLRSDDELYLWRRTEGVDGPVEDWRRCTVVS